MNDASARIVVKPEMTVVVDLGIKPQGRSGVVIIVNPPFERITIPIAGFGSL